MAGVGEELALAEEALVGGVAGHLHVAKYPAVGGPWVRKILRQPAVVVGGVHLRAERQLLEVIEATGPFGFRLGGGNCRQEQGGQNGKDGNDNQHFDERKGAGKEAITRRPAKKPSAGFRNLLALEPNHRSAMPCSLTPTRSGSELCV